MFASFKTTLAAAAIAAMPMYASAATVTLVPDSSNTIALGNSYNYQETVEEAGPGSTSFSLSATPPSGLALVAEFVTLEFTGIFENLQVFINNNLGRTDATEVPNGNQDVNFYTLETVFNSVNGFDQMLTVAWDNVGPNAGSNLGAQFNIQAVPSQVPVPAAGFLLLGALGGAVALRRRRKAA